MISIRAAHGRRRRGLATILLLFGAALLAFSVFMWVQYLNTRQVPELPLATRALGLDRPIYSFSIYGVDHPNGVAVSPDGQRIFVTEGAGERLIRIFDSRGNPLASFSTPGTRKSNRAPMYLAISPDGWLYVTDLDREGIEIYSQGGQLQSTLSPKFKAGEKWRPLALAFDKEGKLFVTDIATTGHRVLVLDRDGTILQQIKGDFSFPNGIAVDDEGRIFVADSTNGRIQVFDKNGQLLDRSTDGGGGQPMALPRGLVLDRDGRLQVIDTFDHSIQVFKFGPSLKFQFSLGSFGYGDGQFAYPGGLAVDRQGRIYIADRENNRVQVWF